jgi:hypothetical protein
MNKELEALLFRVAKATDRGVVGVNEKRAHQWGVPVGKLVRKGEVIPGHSKKAKLTGYYCPYSVWRPPSGECLAIDNNGHAGGPAARYMLAVFAEDSTGEYGFGGRYDRMTLSEMKAYLRGVADGADLCGKPVRVRR